MEIAMIGAGSVVFLAALALAAARLKRRPTFTIVSRAQLEAARDRKRADAAAAQNAGVRGPPALP